MTLAIKKIILYKHGVGFFERQGQVDGDAVVHLHFKATEMNDILKSLTLIDLQGGRISSISYESTQPLEKELESISIRLGDKQSLTSLLNQVKGTPLKIEVGSQILTGLVVGIEYLQERLQDHTVSRPYLTLLIDGQTLQSFELFQIKRLDFLDDTLQKDLQYLLNVLIASKKQELKQVSIFAHGEGQRELFASYITETPVWKTSYRLLIQENASPMIQGWALVDNTQDEDWEAITLSLVAGMPISFVHDLYSPRYQKRPVVEVPQETLYGPPMLEGAMEEYMGDLLLEDEGFAAAAMPVTAAAGGAPGGMARTQAMQQSFNVQAKAEKLGDMFEYKIQNPVTVKRGQSALVPILQSPFEGEKRALYNPEIQGQHPMSAIRFKNTTGVTLEGGPVTVFESGAYMGEAMLETLKPNQEKFLPYGIELGCRILQDHKSRVEAVHYLKAKDGILSQYQYQLKQTYYHIHNTNSAPLTLRLDHPFVRGWERIEPDTPAEETEHFYRFELTVPAEEQIQFTVVERGENIQSHGLANLTEPQLEFWLSQTTLSAAAKNSLNMLAEYLRQAQACRQTLNEFRDTLKQVHANQERLRQNLKALSNSAEEKELRERYISELTAQEDQLKQLETDIAAQKRLKKAADKEIQEFIQSLDFDIALN